MALRTICKFKDRAIQAKMVSMARLEASIRHQNILVLLIINKLISALYRFSEM